MFTPVAAALLLTAGTVAGANRGGPGSPDLVREWTGAWKAADPEVYATFEITDVGAAGFTLEWDEGVGIQGVKERGQATWTGADRARFASEQCTLDLARGAAGRLEATVAEESCFNWSSRATLTFVRADAPVHQRTSFDCGRAGTRVERAVCADRDLAAADRVLADAYESVRRRAGGRGAAIQAAQRRWVAERDRDCGALTDPHRCILLAYGRRILEVRAWPRAPFDAEGRPNVDVLTEVLQSGGARPVSGIRELTAGYVGGIPDEMSLDLHREPDGIWLSGCDAPDRSRGFDPQGIGCGRQHYVAFLRNGEIWAAWADADGVAIVPPPKAGQRLPASLLDFQENHGPPDDDPPR